MLPSVSPRRISVSAASKSSCTVRCLPTSSLWAMSSAGLCSLASVAPEPNFRAAGQRPARRPRRRWAQTRAAAARASAGRGPRPSVPAGMTREGNRRGSQQFRPPPAPATSGGPGPRPSTAASQVNGRAAESARIQWPVPRPRRCVSTSARRSLAQRRVDLLRPNCSIDSRPTGRAASLGPTCSGNQEQAAGVRFVHERLHLFGNRRRQLVGVVGIAQRLADCDHRPGRPPPVPARRRSAGRTFRRR